MRILISPDSFKGSLGAPEAAEAMARGVHRGIPGAEVLLCPLSDGGEGFASLLAGVLGGTEHVRIVTGPMGDPVRAPFHLLRDGSALIETASVVGLGLVPGARRAATETTTRGVGELMLAALHAGARRILIGLGGTATTDGGAGMAHALGIGLEGVPDDVRGGQLASVRHLDRRTVDSRLAAVSVIALTDVDDPLTGAHGAARRYAPQKGANAEQVEALERALVHFASVVGDPGSAPGDGAAGGLGYGLRLFAKAERQRGVDFVLDAVGFDALLDGVDLVLTGEGRIDRQSAHGKVVSGVVDRCNARAIPVVALAGSVAPGAEAAFGGTFAAYSLVNDTVTEDHAVTHAAALLEELAATVVPNHGQLCGSPL